MATIRILSDLLVHIEAITDRQVRAAEPREFVQEDDNVVGNLGMDMRRFYALLQEQGEGVQHAQIKWEQSPDIQTRRVREAILRRAMMVEQIYGLAFWASLFEEHPALWGVPNIFIRRGWAVVWFGEKVLTPKEHGVPVVVATTDDLLRAFAGSEFVPPRSKLN